MNRFLRFSFSRLNPNVFLAGFLFFMLPILGWGQVIISSTSTTSVTENFTGYLGTSATLTSSIPNWSQQGSTTQAGSNQATGTTGGWYGNDNMSFLGSGSAGTSHATWRVKNESGATIDGFTLSFIAKMFRSNTASPTVTITYSSNSTGTLPSAGLLTGMSSFTFSDATPNISTGTTLTRTISGLSIPNNNYLYIRFTHSGGSNSDNLGWDDVKLEPTFIPSINKPTLSLPTSTSITTTSATLGATINSDGGETITASGIAYATTTNPTSPTSNTAGPVTSGTFTVNVTGLNSNTKYFYRGFATNPTAGTGYSADGSFITLPSAPVSDVPSIIGVNSFVASWSDVSGSEAEEYLIDVATDNTFASGNIITNGNVGAVTSYNVTGLTAGTTYYVRVRAQNTSGSSLYSNVVSVTTNTSASAPTVSNLAVSAITNSTATISAEVLNSGGATVIARGFFYGTTANPTGNDTPSGSGLGVFNANLSGLSPNTTYYYRAYATNSAGTDLTADGTFTTATDAPVATAANLIAPTGFTAYWDAVTGATNYRLDVSTSSIFTSYVPGYQNLTVSGTNQTVTGLTAGKTYYYRVRSNNGTVSDNSNVISVLTISGTPVATSANAITYIGFTANWGTVSGASGYKLDVATDNAFTSMVSGYNDLTVASNSQVVSGLAASTTYYYRVRAVNASGTSGNSNTISVTTLSNTGLTLVNWDFTDNNATADGGIAQNLTKTISKVGATGTSSYNGTANSNGWHDGDTEDKYWLIDFATLGYESIKLSSKQRGSNSGPRDFKIQYQIGATTGTWLDVPGGTVTAADNYTTGAVTNLAIPNAASNQSKVYVRWKVTSTVAVNGGVVGSGGNSNIDDIIIKGDVVSSTPSIADPVIGGMAPFCAGTNTFVYFNSTGSFNEVSGNKFKIELSDNSGSFTSPVNIGYGNESPINVIIPSISAAGNNYKVRVVSSDPAIISNTSGTFEILNPVNNLVTLSGATSQTITTSTTGTLITATAANTSTFTWKFGTVSGSYISTISGATSASYSPKGSDFGTPGTYYLVAVATSTCGAVEGVSAEVTIEVLPPASSNSKAEAVASSEAITISSLQNASAINSNTDGVQVWQVKLFDGDGITDDADDLPTQFSGFTFTKGASNTVADWAASILGLQFFEDNNTTPIAGSITVSASNIVFTPTTPIQVMDGAGNYKTLSLRLSLKNPLPALSDNKIFQFSLTKANIATGSPTTSSQMQTAAFTLNSAVAFNKIAVEGTTVKFIQQPTNVLTLTNMAPAVTLEYVDANGNRDLDGSVSITASGAVLTGSPVTATANAGTGIFSFGSLQFSTYGNNVSLTAAIGASNVTSSTFTVNAGNEQYSYRSARSGFWATVTTGSETWERSMDGTTWVPVSLASELPNATSGPISIGNGHEVTINASVSADQLSVSSGGTLTILVSNTLTIADGTGTDLSVNGTVKNAGTILQNTGSTAAFNANSIYDHAVLAGFGVIPVASWNITSTVKITGHSGSGGSATSANYDQAFGNFQWNATGQYGSINLLGELRNVQGNLEILNTNANELRLSGNASYNLTIGGDLRIGSGVILVGSNGSSGTHSIILSGNLQISGGTLKNDNNSSPLAFNFAGSNKTFTNTGTVTGTNINWIISTAAKLTLNSDITVATGRTFTVNGQLNTQDKIVKGAGSFNLTSTGTLGIGSAQGITTSGANGSVQVTNSRAYNSAATYHYNGTTAQVTGNGFPPAGAKLTVDNGAGLTLTNAAEVSNLTLTQGVLTTGTSNLLTVSSSGSLNYSGLGSYINGPLARKLTSAAVLNFPIGKGAKPRFITLDIASQGAGENIYTAEQFDSEYSTTTALPASVTHISGVRYFNISKSGTAAVSARITLTYAADDKVTEADKLTIVKFNASGAEDLNATAATSDLEGTITSDYFTSFSDFVLANKVGGNNPLPVELQYFTAKPSGKTVHLNWATASEKNSLLFEVQRSSDARTFETIGTLTAQGNSNTQKRYAFDDKNPLAGISYYRLKQTDLDGTFTYSATKQVKIGEKAGLVTMYPNPTNGMLYLILPVNEAVNIKVINVLGQAVLNQKLEAASQINLNLNDLPAGTYQVIVTGRDLNSVQKIVKTTR